ncbi:hypothetical protein [Streptomyces sp. NPDC015350]|uniref:hypothetical protein n=1 Tax=Streptomyces sp. NPDC015350 TaxID=3364955 RepID=UPI0036F7D5FB
MPKSRKRRTARPRSRRKELHRRLAAPLGEPRPKHPSYEQACPDDVLIDEFGEEGATWLRGEYGRPLTLAEFGLEHSIRTNEFLLDDPFTGPKTTTAEEISKMIGLTTDVILAMAKQQGVLSAEQAREHQGRASRRPRGRGCRRRTRRLRHGRVLPQRPQQVGLQRVGLTSPHQILALVPRPQPVRPCQRPRPGWMTPA